MTRGPRRSARPGQRTAARRPVRVAGLFAELLAVAVGALALSGCGGDGGDPTRVFLFGDSLVYEASEYWLDLMAGSGRWEATQSSLAGTATCDFLDLAARTRDEVDPEVVALSFSGNALGECMRDEAGEPLAGEAYEAKYRRDTEAVLSLFGPDVNIYLVGAPTSLSGDDRVYEIYRDVAAGHANVQFVDGGRIVSPGRRFVETQPCLPDEECLGPVVDGVPSNVVRSPDGGHFCPTEHPVGERCPVYSSGAYRFALTIYEALEAGAPDPAARR